MSWHRTLKVAATLKRVRDYVVAFHFESDVVSMEIIGTEIRGNCSLFAWQQ
jgi:hypothetical protein